MFQVAGESWAGGEHRGWCFVPASRSPFTELWRAHEVFLGICRGREGPLWKEEGNPPLGPLQTFQYSLQPTGRSELWVHSACLSCRHGPLGSI